MPAEASAVLKKSVNSVNAAKQELKEAAKLKAEAAVDQRRAKGLEGRVVELEHYQNDKHKFAENAEELAHKADEEYAAEEKQVKEMDAEEGGGLDFTKGAEGDAALRHRLQRHLPLLRVVDKLAQRVVSQGRGRHPRFRRGSKRLKEKSPPH